MDGTGGGPDVWVDSTGNVYGTTDSGGPNGGGILYELTLSGDYEDLHDFGGEHIDTKSGLDGGSPSKYLFVDPFGDVFGACSVGGAEDAGMLWEWANAPVSDAVASFTLSPSIVLGGSSATGTLTLHGYALSAGVYVGLTSNSSVVKIPSTVYVAPGHRSASFSFNTTPTSTTVTGTLTASIVGYPQADKTAELTVQAAYLDDLTISPNLSFGGVKLTGKVSLNGPAASSGSKVLLKSSSIDATVPATVEIPAGQSSATFAITTKSVPATVSALISATLGSVTKNFTIQVLPPLKNLSITPDSVAGGSTADGTIKLNGPAPSGGLTVTLSSSDTSVASVPTSVVIPTGATSKTFTVTTHKGKTTQTVSIIAESGASAQGAKITVKP